MKIPTLTSLVLLIALMQQVAAQQPCAIQEDCLGNTYCNSNSNTCLPVGGCVEVADCSDKANFPYAMPMCMGTTICSDGVCGIDCGVFPPEDDKIKCKSNEDCPVSLDGSKQYCASDGICEEMGGCAVAEDCGKRENDDYMLAACVGTITCTERRCGILCDGADVSPKVPGSCLSHEDCPVGGYCASDGQCEKIGGCATVADCWLEENQGYPIPACMGEMQCADRRCDMRCTGSDALFPCLTSDACIEPETYCNSFEFCGKNGSCVTDEDCSKEDNFYMEIECVGRKYCDGMGMCAKDCSSAPIGAACGTSLDCADGEYCAGNGSCLPFGACDVPGDCTALGNDIFFPACVGTIFCEAGMCGKTCDGAGEPFPAKEFDGEDGSAVDIEIFCTTDDDCNNSITAATARSAFPHEELYCAAGTCKPQGYCSTDNDCINPSNIYFSDKRCIGFLFCTEEGKCDRECSSLCKDGSLMAQCDTNPCDTNDWASCDGAASCVLTTCGNTCDYMLFDAAGNVLPDCAVASNPTIDGSVSITKDGATDFVTREGEDSAQEVMSLESSAVRATSLVAVVALALGVVMV